MGQICKSTTYAYATITALPFADKHTQCSKKISIELAHAGKIQNYGFICGHTTPVGSELCHPKQIFGT